jgi:hypothetical protein
VDDATSTPAKTAVTRVTLDTDVIRDYWERRPGWEDVEKLLDLAAAGEIELAVTERIHDDIPRPPLSERIGELPTLEILKTATAARLDTWTLGHHMLGDEDFVAAARQITDDMAKTMNPDKLPDWRDWDHVHAHYLLRRDVFITKDKKLRMAVNQLPEEIPIVIMTPAEFLVSHARSHSDPE